MERNVNKVIGKVGEQHEHYWVLNAEREITDNDGEISIYEDEIHVFGKAPSWKRAMVAGPLKQFEVEEDGESVRRTYLEPAICERAKKDEYANIGQLIGKYFRWRMFHTEGTDLGAQLVKIGSSVLRAVLFDNPRFRAMTGWDAQLRAKNAKNQKSDIKMYGRLRVWQNRLELLADEYDVIRVGHDDMDDVAAEIAAKQAESNPDEHIPTSEDLDAEPAF